MAHTATVTGKVGPGYSLAASVFTNLSFFSFDPIHKLLSVTSNGVEYKIDITAAATITCTVTGGNYVLTVT